MEKKKILKIFIGCLPADTVQHHLKSYFNRFCRVACFKIKYRSNGVCSGYGHFICTNPNKAVLQKLFNSTHYYKDRDLECRPYLKGSALESYQKEFNMRRVYVKNLPPYMTDVELKQEFSKFGKVYRAYRANKPDKKGISFGFVIFTHQGVIEQIIDSDIYLKGYKIEIKKV